MNWWCRGCQDITEHTLDKRGAQCGVCGRITATAELHSTLQMSDDGIRLPDRNGDTGWLTTGRGQ